MDQSVKQEALEVFQVPIASITVNRDQRIRSSLDNIEELARDIAARGLINAIVITPEMKLVSGERRIAAFRLLGREIIDCVFKPCASDLDLLLMELAENIQRENFCLKDLIKAANELMPMIRDVTKARQLEALTGNENTVPVDQPERETFEVRPGEEAREAIARILNTGYQRLDRAMKLAEVAKTDPEIAIIAAKMLDDENVNAAWEAYRAVLEARKPPVPETPLDDQEDATDDPDDAGEEPVDADMSGSVGKSDGRRADERPAKKVKGKGKSAAPAAPALELSPPDPELVPVHEKTPDDSSGPEPSAGKPVSRAKQLGIYSATEYIEFCDELMHYLAKPQQQKVVNYYRDIYGPAAPKAPEPPESPEGGPPPEPPAPAPTTPAEVATQLRRNIEGLPKKQQKDAVVASAVVLSELGKKPTVYLPRLPDEHGDAIGQIQEEITARVTALNQFAGWDLNGRQTTARQLVKTMQAKAMSVKKICGIESMEDIQQPELFDTKWPEHLNTPEVKAVWEIWLSNRKKRKLPVDAAVMEKQIRNLSILDAEQAVEVITSAHENNWHGIREDVCKKMWCNRAPGGAGTEKRPSPKQVIEREKELLAERREKLEVRAQEAIKQHTAKLTDYSEKSTSLNAAYHAAKVCKDHIAKDLMMPEDMQRMLETRLMIIARKAFFSTHPELEPKD
jgi:hypothetical protein